jgi:TPP-dependent indolepyruvate ferredoxin oxidoreductase alpha subunit
MDLRRRGPTHDAHARASARGSRSGCVVVVADIPDIGSSSALPDDAWTPSASAKIHRTPLGWRP